MSIMLDTPEQINMWVLLSRRQQVQMHLKGYKVRGILTWGKQNFPGEVKTVKDMVLAIETAIAMAGGQADYRLVNVHVCLKRGGMFFDLGVYPDMATVEANEDFVEHYKQGRLEIMLTTEAVRDRIPGQVYVAD